MTRSGNAIYLILFFLPAFLLVPGTGFSQHDSIKPGVMKVRRAPVPSDYLVKVSYTYLEPKRKLFHRIFHGTDSGFGGEVIDGIFYAPQPVSIPQREDDTLRMMEDSTFLMQFFEKDDRPAGDYEWTNWLDQNEHYFAWSDTAGIDSCVFFYEVGTNGRVRVIPGEPYGNDSSAVAMQNELWPLMRKLWLWYPAVQLVGDSQRQRKVKCIVTVKVYAVRDDQKDKMPFRVVD